VEIIQKLWDADISAELARDSRSPEDLLLKYRDELHSWILIIKQDSVVKIKSMGRKEVPDTDIPSTQLLSWLRAEIRERDHREGTNHRVKMQRNHSQVDTGAADHEQEVRVLVAGTKSKKSNRRNIVEQAQARAATVTQSFLGKHSLAVTSLCPILEMESHKRTMLMQGRVKMDQLPRLKLQIMSCRCSLIRCLIRRSHCRVGCS